MKRYSPTLKNFKHLSEFLRLALYKMKENKFSLYLMRMGVCCIFFLQRHNPISKFKEEFLLVSYWNTNIRLGKNHESILALFITSNTFLCHFNFDYFFLIFMSVLYSFLLYPQDIPFIAFSKGLGLPANPQIVSKPIFKLVILSLMFWSWRCSL